MDALLRVERLTTIFDLPGGPVPAVNDVSFEIRQGETLGIVGESGSGKSVTAFSIMRLVQPPGRIASGAVYFKGRNLLQLSEREMQRVRGAEISRPRRSRISRSLAAFTSMPENITEPCAMRPARSRMRITA